MNSFKILLGMERYLPFLVLDKIGHFVAEFVDLAFRIVDVFPIVNHILLYFDQLLSKRINGSCCRRVFILLYPTSICA